MRNFPKSDETCFSLLTPPGKGAIATLALRGPKVWDILAGCFQPASRLSGERQFVDAIKTRNPEGKFWLGTFGEAGDPCRDEVVLAWKSGQPVPWFEIHGHGGSQIVQLLEECLLRRGLTQLSWPAFLRWAQEEKGKALALTVLASASTVRTANILLDQYHGAFHLAISKIRSALDQEKIDVALGKLEELKTWTSLGRHLIDPWKVVIAGAPNVGKSSLMNFLAGFQRAVVSDIPGTTRDLVTIRLAFDGWPVELFDTAGMREEGEELEKQGMDLALAAAEKADLCLWLLEVSAPPVLPMRKPANLLYVINKIDLPAKWNLESVPEASLISITDRKGVEELMDRIARKLVPHIPPKGSPLPFTPELCLAIEEAVRVLRSEKKNQVETILQEMWDLTADGDSNPPADTHFS